MVEPGRNERGGGREMDAERVCSECGHPTSKHPTNWCLPGMGPAPHVVPKPGYPKRRWPEDYTTRDVFTDEERAR